MVYLQRYFLTHLNSNIFTDIDVIVPIWLKSSYGAQMILPFELEIHEPASNYFCITRQHHHMPRHCSDRPDL